MNFQLSNDHVQNTYNYTITNYISLKMTHLNNELYDLNHFCMTKNTNNMISIGCFMIGFFATLLFFSIYKGGWKKIISELLFCTMYMFISVSLKRILSEDDICKKINM